MIWEWFRINSFYGLSLIFIYFTYSYLLKEYFWKREWPHILYYFSAFTIVGLSFNYFLEPNYIKAVYKIFKNQFSFIDMSILITASLYWVGWAIIFSQLEQFVIRKLKRKETPKPILDYVVYFFFYMLFLNSLTIILNYTFNRPI